MARIELRDTTIRLKDGLSGTGALNEASPTSTDTTAGVDATVLNGTNTRRIPVGARFTVSTAGNTTTYTVTARTESLGVDEVQSLSASGATAGTFTLTITLVGESLTPVTTATIAFDAAPAAIQTAIDTALAVVASYVAGDVTVSGSGTAEAAATVFTFDGTNVLKKNQPLMTVDGTGLTGGGSEAITVTTEGEYVNQTTNITFTPAWGTPTPADNDTITYLPQQLGIKIGEGNLTYTENKDYEYLLDRGTLDTVRENDEQPMEITIGLTYEFITTGTGEAVTPIDALKQKNGAAEWVSGATDLCEPYAVDVEIDHNPACGATEKELTIFPDFRHDSLEMDLDASTITATGRCKATEPTVTRVAV